MQHVGLSYPCALHWKHELFTDREVSELSILKRRGSLDFYEISSIFICWQLMQTFLKCIVHQIKIDQ